MRGVASAWVDAFGRALFHQLPICTEGRTGIVAPLSFMQRNHDPGFGSGFDRDSIHAGRSDGDHQVGKTGSGRLLDNRFGLRHGESPWLGAKPSDVAENICS